MSLMLAKIKNTRDNNFNLLQFLAALLVLFGHSYALSNSYITHEWLFGHVAVDIFFIISGYVVTVSFFTGKNIWIFTQIRKPILNHNMVKKLFVLISILGMGVYTYYLYNHFDVNNSSVHFVAIFFTGGLLWLYREHILLSNRIFFGILFFIFFIFTSSYFLIIYSLFIGYIVLYLAYMPAGSIRTFNKLGDYSYGMYIYVFPIQQSYAASFPEITGLTLFFVSSITTLFFGILSWYFIEKPALSFKKILKK